MRARGNDPQHKYMVDAYPPGWHGGATTRDRKGLVRLNGDGALRVSAESAAGPDAGELERAVPAAGATTQAQLDADRWIDEGRSSMLRGRPDLSDQWTAGSDG